MIISFNKPKRLVNKVFIHCSASDIAKHDNIETIRDWHLTRKPDPFKEIGYHYFIDKKGGLFNGRSLEKTPVAQVGFNNKTIAICCSGLQNFTQAQFDTLKILCNLINTAYNQNVTFHGHCEVNPDKTCPVFDYKTILNLDSTGKIVIK
jgi:N-acetyl-anhydromuramyl-L-alanine amidase AmpD